MTRFRRLTPVTTLALFALLLLAAAVVVRVGFGLYLNSESFRRKIATAVGHVLKAEGTFSPLQRTGGIFYSDEFIARGSGAAFFSDLRADQIRADLDWRGLLHRTVQIDELTVQKLDIRFAEPPRGAHGGSAPPEPMPTIAGSPPNSKPRSAWIVDLRKASIAESSWHWRTNDGNEGGVEGSAFTLTPSGDSWLIEANSGKVSQTGWPELSIESAKLRYTGSSLFVTDGVLQSGSGRIAVNGEVAFRRAADVQAQFDNLSITPLLPPDWRVRLTGNLSGSAKIHAPFSGDPIHVEGDMHLLGGQIEALPLLDQIATFTRTDRFRRMTLSTASLSFTRDARLITAKDIIVESEGLMRIEGACTVLNDRIDGVFQIGVTAASLQWLPGSQARVFTIAHDGYFWTPLRLTGPVSHPTEDLTPRLVAAAAGEILQDTHDVLQDAAKGILDLLPH